MANKDFKIKNGLDIQSPLPVSMGGTGQTTAENTLNALLPSQTGNANKVLSTDGTSTTWAAQATAYQRGGTASRPASPSVGDLYYNTDTSVFEQYVSTGWFIVAAPPSAPTSVTATNSGSGRAFNNGSASVAFSAGTSGGITSSFVVTQTPSTSPATFSGSSSPVTVTNLASSTQYTYTVTGSSAYGTSSASSASTAVTATTVPQAPTIDSVTGGDAQVSVAFTAGATGGSSITGFTVTSSPGSLTASGASSPLVVTGLTNGTAYTFTMTATNANGTSAASSASSSVTSGIVGDFDSIATVTVGSSAQSTITFSSIPQTYKHLHLRITAKSDNAYNYQEVALKVNGSSGIYTRHLLYGDGSTANYDGRQQGDDAYFMSFIAGGNAPSQLHGINIVDFLDYSSTSKTKSISTLFGLDRNGSGFVGIQSSQINSTSAVSSISITSQGPGNNFVQHSSFALYGIKG